MVSRCSATAARIFSARGVGLLLVHLADDFLQKFGLRMRYSRIIFSISPRCRAKTNCGKGDQGAPMAAQGKKCNDDAPRVECYHGGPSRIRHCQD